MVAASAGHTDAVETLLDSGADITTMDKDDKTAMFWAAEQGHFETLKVILLIVQLK